MGKIYIVDNLLDLDTHYNTYKNYVNASPSELEAYIWNSDVDDIDIYFSADTLTYYRGDTNDYLCKVGTNSFAGIVFFPNNVSIASINRAELGTKLANKFNELLDEESDITYSPIILDDTLEFDSLGNDALYYTAEFPEIQIHEGTPDNRVDVHLRVYYPCNAFLVYLEIVNKDKMCLPKIDVINTVLNELTSYVEDNE